MTAEDLMVRVPQVWTKIFFCLDGRSLHNCRQVSRVWNDFILSQVWGSQPGRRQMRRNLGLAWQHGTTQRSEEILFGKQSIFQCELKAGYGHLTHKTQVEMFRFNLENAKNWGEFDVLKHCDNVKSWMSEHLVIGLDEKSLVFWEKQSKRILFSKVLSNPTEHQTKFDSKSRELVRALGNEWTATPRLEVEKFKVGDDGIVKETVHNIRMQSRTKIALRDYRSPYLLTLDLGKKMIGLCVSKLEGGDIEEIKTVETNLINRQRGPSYVNEALLNYPYVIVTSTYAKMFQLQLWNIETGQCIKEFSKSCYNFGCITWMEMMDRKILLTMANYVLLRKCRSSVHVFDLDNLISEDSIVTRELDVCPWAPLGATDVFLNKTSTAIGTIQKRKEDHEFYFNYLSFWS